MYNGLEIQEALGVDFYESDFRILSPEIGRWWQVDPKVTDSESAYAGMKNNPIAFIDPKGDTSYYFTPQGEYLGVVNDGLENQIHFISQDKLVNLVGNYGGEATYSNTPANNPISFADGTDLNSFSAEARGISEAYIGREHL